MLIKQIIAFITGIPADTDSEENQEAWERRRDADVNDLDDYTDLVEGADDESEVLATA